ncbi:MAG TPA: hypothetical protein VFO10_10750 [Oligoflexus sp.]|uniref:hypothetical protein n=1 Tax=Oligoflexus sp. TaxID=1971216 RepID=UPI002D804E69|nr:hypothetical protein [Oligoflexus sp.]HET9237723.1 hypothetical protein [Oligoflexus sp.]
MKKFLAIFIGSVSQEQKKAEKPMSLENLQAGMAAWGEWVNQNQKFILDMGSPLGKTKRIDRNGITQFENRDTAYVVVQAESHEAAAKLFLNHPHFMIFPGDSVEVMECLPVPGA